MKRKRRLLKKLTFCGIVDDGNASLVKGLAGKGVTSIQFRRKNCPSEIVAQKAIALKKAARKYGIAVFVNDRADAAIAANADGVHIGKGDMDVKLVRRILGRKYIIGKTARSVKDARLGEKEGADYVSIGPVFKTPLKKDIRARGLGLLKRVKSKVSIPVIAIGGINPSNLGTVLKSGVDGVGMIRGLR